MLGFLLVVIQVLLFLCAAGLLLLMRKSIWQAHATGGGYMPSYQDEEPDYRNYEYADDTDGGYHESYEQSDPNNLNTAHQQKAQQYEYAGETEHYDTEMAQEQHFARQSETYAYQDTHAAAAQSFKQDQMVPPPSTDMAYRQNSDQTTTPSQAETPRPYLNTGSAPAYPQPTPEPTRYYSEDIQEKAARSQHYSEEPLPKPKSHSELKGVLFDDNDDDTAPFKVKF